MTSLDKKIDSLLCELPDVKGVLNTTSNHNSELVLVVDDVLTWHKENVIINPKYYGSLGKKMVNNANNTYELTGSSFYTKNKDISLGKSKVDIITVSESDFDICLTTWNSIALANRFHRDFKVVKSNDVIDNALLVNLDAMIRCALYFIKDGADIFDLYSTILAIEYIGNRKNFDLINLVESNFLFFRDILKDEDYKLRSMNDSVFDYFKISFSGSITVDRERLFKDYYRLPVYLADFISKYKLYSFYDIKDIIKIYIKNKNRMEYKESILKEKALNGYIYKLIRR